MEQEQKQSEVKMQPSFDYTSQEFFNVPIFRFVGQADGFIILNNLNKERVGLPVQALGSLIEQLQKYQAYLEESKEVEEPVTADDAPKEE